MMKRLGLGLMIGAALAFGGCDENGDGEDAGTDSGMVTQDAGGMDAGPSCGPMNAPAPSPTMVCQASTLECLQMAGNNQSAVQACFQADPMAEACIGCILQDIDFTATAAGGCAAQFGELQCCLEAAGCTAGDRGCRQANTMPGAACAAEGEAYQSCVSACAGMSCGFRADVCFMPGADGGPMEDGGVTGDAAVAEDGGVTDGAVEDGGVADDGGVTDDGGAGDGGLISLPDADI